MGRRLPGGWGSEAAGADFESGQSSSSLRALLSGGGRWVTLPATRDQGCSPSSHVAWGSFASKRGVEVSSWLIVVAKQQGVLANASQWL